MMRYIGRVAVVTGASSGHGRAIALRLASEGAAVLNVDLNRSPRSASAEDAGDLTTDELIRQRGGRADFIKGDISSLAQMQQAADHAVRAFGRLDVWVNNAGISLGSHAIGEESEESFLRVIDVNLTGVWRASKAAASVMGQLPPVGRTRGHIVNIGSVAGLIGQRNLAAYSSSKGAVHTLTKALAIELAPDLITVNAVAPGYFPTAMNQKYWEDPQSLERIRSLHPLPLGVPGDVAAAVAFLGSDQDAAFITGVVLPVDGGMSAD